MSIDSTMAETTETQQKTPKTQLDTHVMDSGLICLAIMAKVLGKPADPEQLRHLSGRGSGEMDTNTLLRLAKDIGFKARLMNTSWERLNKVELPVIAQHQSGEYFLLAQVGDDKVAVQEPRSQQVKILDKEAFMANWSGALLLLTTRAQLAGENRKFGLSWFIPAIHRYRKILKEVLIVSFILQLFALATPLFFQVIIDKVLVHHSLNTLNIMIIALLCVSFFEAVLGGLRTYIFTHTSNRIDVELGARLFKHMQNLPIRYFASRRVGHIVARVRELEGIRQFLTSSSITVLIDSFFTIVFLIVMWFYSKNLTLLVLLTLPFYIALTWFITPVLRRRLEEKFMRGAENQAFLVESISGIETLKSSAIEPQSQRKWEELLAGYTSSAFKASHTSNIGQQGVQLVNKVSTALVLWFGATYVIEGTLTVGQLGCL